jgi:hypothetical protein
MLSYIEYSFKDLAIEHICNQNNLDFTSFLVTETKIETIYPQSSQDLDVIDSLGGQDLFESSDLPAQPLIIDLVDKAIPPVQKLTDLIQSDNQFYLVRSQKPLLTLEKKDLKKAGIVITEIKKPNPKTLQSLLASYTNQKQIVLTPSLSAKLIKNVANYTELIDLLDVYQLSESDPKIITNVIDGDEILPFMKGFNPSVGLSGMASWYNISSDDIQLHISILLSKLLKLRGDSSDKIADLVKTDYTIKQVSAIAPLVWWKLYLYKITRS